MLATYRLSTLRTTTVNPRQESAVCLLISHSPCTCSSETRSFTNSLLILPQQSFRENTPLVNSLQQHSHKPAHTHACISSPYEYAARQHVRTYPPDGRLIHISSSCQTFCCLTGYNCYMLRGASRAMHAWGQPFWCIFPLFFFLSPRSHAAVTGQRI
jgi:hypothetical protein